jgi:phosphoribosylglycinamide formyltransferase-1
MLRLAILASGRGSNLQAILDAIAAGHLDARIAGVFSDKPGAGALSRARGAGLHAVACAPGDFTTREAHDEAMFSQVAAVQPDLIVCAGYMRLVSEAAVQRFAGRMINIHPSLLPRYPGLHTHRRALEAGDAEHGASVHLVIPELDAGQVLAQARIAVRPDDSEQSLATRLLPREHALLLACLGAIADGRLRLPALAAGGDTSFRGRPLASPLRLDEHDELQEAA